MLVYKSSRLSALEYYRLQCPLVIVEVAHYLVRVEVVRLKLVWHGYVSVRCKLPLLKHQVVVILVDDVTCIVIDEIAMLVHCSIHGIELSHISLLDYVIVEVTHYVKYAECPLVKELFLRDHLS